jgi:hypothetical protein
MDRERIQQWVVASSRARPENGSSHRVKPSSSASVQQSSSKAQDQRVRKPETSSVLPQEILFQGQLAWDIGFNQLMSQAESALNVARDTCAALMPLDQSKISPRDSKTTISSVHQPSTAMLFSQYEKSRRAKRLQAVTEDDASGLSTASAFSDIQSVQNSSRLAASSRGVPASTASRRG